VVEEPEMPVRLRPPGPTQNGVILEFSGYLLGAFLAHCRFVRLTMPRSNSTGTFVPASRFGRCFHHEQIQAYAFLLRAGGKLRVPGFRHADAERAAVALARTGLRQWLAIL
jgi:hypothetical protein